MARDSDASSKRRGGGAAAGSSSKRRKAAAPSDAAASAREAAAADVAPHTDVGDSDAAHHLRIGVISDNHGYLDPEVLEIFAGVTHIIHAGDVMDPEILTALREVAPVTAVAGNLDSGELATELPREATGEIGGVRFVVSHKPRRLLKRLASGKISVGEKGTHPDLVVWGHLHTPTAAWVDGALHLNPGTASAPEEEDDGPTVAIVEATAGGLSVHFIPLKRRPVDEGAG